MAIGRLYYTIACLLLCSFFCVSHYEAKYPERGFRPWSGFRNRHRRAQEDEVEAEELRRAANGRLTGHTRARESEARERGLRREREVGECARPVRARYEADGDPRRHAARASDWSPPYTDPRRAGGAYSPPTRRNSGWWGGDQEATFVPIQRWR